MLRSTGAVLEAVGLEFGIARSSPMAAFLGFRACSSQSGKGNCGRQPPGSAVPGYKSIERHSEGTRLMPKLKTLLFAAGLLAALIGFIWALQGAGIFRYPPESFMIDQRPWIWRGALVCVVGLALALFSRRG
jgi:hypothetical protein